jgi:hypothetical protein
MPKLLATLHLFTMAAPALATRVEFGMQDFPRHSAPGTQAVLMAIFGWWELWRNRPCWTPCYMPISTQRALRPLSYRVSFAFVLGPLPPIAENAQRVFVALSVSAEVAA